MKPLPWSYSALDDFVNCPKAYYEKKVAKSVKEAESEQLIWGNKVHKAFEERMAHGVVLPDMLAAHEEYMKFLEKLPGKAFTERKIAMNLSQQVCAFFDRDVWFRGVIDYSKIDKDRALLVDYKTGKKHQKFEQLALFALHTFAEHAAVQQVKVCFYWTEDKSQTTETYNRSSIPMIWQKFIPNLRQYNTAFKTETFVARPSGLCRGWCPVTTCEHWKPKRVR
jgi:RecB family exonuclease